jgi:hypothetical protein
MKKTLKLLLVLVAVVGIFGLTGCGKKADLSKYAGTYVGEYSKFVGSTEKDTEAFSVELKSDGTGVSRRGSGEYKITWSIDGENFKMTEKFIGTIDYTGTLKDGKLHIYNGEPTNDLTYEYVYNKQ